MIQCTLLKTRLVKSEELKSLIEKNRICVVFLRCFDFHDEDACHEARSVYQQYRDIQDRIFELLDGAMFFDEKPIEKLSYSCTRKHFRKKHTRRIIEMRSRSCELCGNPVSKVLEIHHLIPLSRGGKSDEENFAILCPTCHKATHECINSGRITDEIRDYYAGIENAIEKLDFMVNIGIQNPFSF